MVPQWVGVVVLVLPLGLALGYLAAMPRVMRLELELARQEQLPSKSLARKIESYQVLVKQLESKLVQAEAQDLILQSALDSAQMRLSDSELELVRVKKLQSLRETELAMELEKVRAQVWVQRE
jgi:hypothetical protein